MGLDAKTTAIARARCSTRSALDRQSEAAVHAVSALQLANAARAARLRRRHRRAAAVRGGRGGGRRPHVVLTGDYHAWSGRWEPTELPPGRRCASRGRSTSSSIPNGSSRTSWSGCSAQQSERVIDTHAHLDALEEPDGAVDRARAAGVGRIVTIGTGIELVPARRSSSPRTKAYMRRSGSTRTRPRLARLRASPSSAALLDHPKAVAVGEAGLDYHYGADAKEEQRRLFSAQLALAAELSLPIVVHTRSANDDTESMLRDHDGTVVMHCFSEPELLAAGLERGWYFSFAGNATYPEGRGAPRRRRGRPRRPDPCRDGQPLSRAAARSWPAERACARRPHGRGARRGAR